MKKIKVIHFIYGFSIGGAENLVKQYSILFDKRKIDLLVVALHNYHSLFDKELYERNINVIYVDDIIDEKFRFYTETMKKAMHRIYRKRIVKNVITNYSPDVIHYHLLLSSYVKYINPGNNIKIFLTVHTDPHRIWSKKMEREKDRKATEWLIKNKNLRLIALHEDMRKELNKMFGVKDTIIIKNGIIVDKFAISTPKQKIMKKFGIKKSALVIGHIGRFSEVKNHRFLLTIFESFLKINQRAVLILVGDGELRTTIKQLVTEKNLDDKVYFLGIRSDIAELLHIMDVLVFPSYREGLPISLIEAQAAKVPCLVSDTVTSEVKISNLIHFESLDNSADEWANAINRILLDKTDPKIDLGKWDLKGIVRELEDLYGNNGALGFF